MDEERIEALETADDAIIGYMPVLSERLRSLEKDFKFVLILLVDIIEKKEIPWEDLVELKLMRDKRTGELHPIIKSMLPKDF